MDRKHAKTIIIIGEDELKQGVVNIKDIKTQQQVTVKIDEIVSTLNGFLKGE